MTQPLYDPTLPDRDADTTPSEDRADCCRYCGVDDCLVCDWTGPYFNDPAEGRWGR